MRTLTLLALAACAAPAVAQTGIAKYELTWTGTWSQASHPIDYPGGAHFSGLIGGTHDDSVTFWEPGGIASNGMESMAESGSTGALASEVNGQVNAGSADQVLFGPALGATSTATMPFTINAEKPLFTLVAMIAPSPDWFVGVGSLNLLENGLWVDDLTVDLLAWDSGTDSGTTYLSPNADITPHIPIQTVTQSSGPFQNAPLVVGTFHFRLVSSGRIYGCGINPEGSLSTNGLPLLGFTVGMGIDDPTDQMSTGSSTALMLSGQSAPGFPCGIAVPGIGLGPVDSSGEFLIGDVFAVLDGPDWNGSPVTIPIDVPNSNGLLGLRLFLQGALVSPGRIGVTDAAEWLIGD